MTLNPWAWVQTQIEKTRHPVGYIFEFDPTGLDGAPDLTTPEKVASYFGYGVWARYGDGRVTVGVVDKKYAAGATGGEEKHTLTIAEMPNHNHSYASYQDGYPNSVIDVDKFITPVGRKPYDDYAYNGTRCSYSGGDKPHNNMQPYICVYRWRRVA